MFLSCSMTEVHRIFGSITASIIRALVIRGLGRAAGLNWSGQGPTGGVL
jgi:hypothetical protein